MLRKDEAEHVEMTPAMNKAAEAVITILNEAGISSADAMMVLVVVTASAIIQAKRPEVSVPRAAASFVYSLRTAIRQLVPKTGWRRLGETSK